MKRLLAIVAVAAVAATAIVASAATGQPVEHVTLAPGENMADVAGQLCPQNPAAQLADLQASNGSGGGSVLHYHPGACTGQVTSTAGTTPSSTTSTPPTSVATTMEPSTSSSVATSSTTLPASSTTTTVVASTSSTSPPTTTQPPPSSTLPTTSTTTTSTTTTLPAPSTTVAGGTQQFAAAFATPTDFYDRFWTYTGNYCTFGTTCRPENIPSGVVNFSGDHNTACEAPTTQRTVSITNHANLFWWCAPGGADTGHVMVGLATSGYAIVGFTPRQAFTNVQSICWDQNLTDLGGGIWSTITLVPASVFTSHPNTNPRAASEGEGPYRLDYTLPEFDADNSPGDFNLQRQSRWQFKLFRNELRIFDRIGSSNGDWGVSNGFIAGNDKATRYRHCLMENASGLVTVTQRSQSWTTNLRFPDGPVYVIFASDIYDSEKHGPTVHKTWHFDSIEVLYG